MDPTTAAGAPSTVHRARHGGEVGAIRFSGTWRTTAPPDDVYAVVADLTTWPRWWPAIRAVEPVTGDPGAPDEARFTFDTPAPLPPLVVGIAVTGRVAGSELEVAATDGPIDGEGRLTVRADDGATGTAFALRLEVRSLLLKPVEMVLASAARGSARERLARAGDDLAALAGGEPLPHDL
jgi:hypothetical protein